MHTVVTVLYFFHIFSKSLSNDTEKMIETGQKKIIPDPYCIASFSSGKFKMFVKLDNFFKKLFWE